MPSLKLLVYFIHSLSFLFVSLHSSTSLSHYYESKPHFIMIIIKILFVSCLSKWNRMEWTMKRGPSRSPTDSKSPLALSLSHSLRFESTSLLLLILLDQFNRFNLTTITNIDWTSLSLSFLFRYSLLLLNEYVWLESTLLSSMQLMYIYGSSWVYYYWWWWW